MSKDKEHKERIRAKRKKTRKKPIKNEENYFNMEFTVPKRKKDDFLPEFSVQLCIPSSVAE